MDAAFGSDEKTRMPHVERSRRHVCLTWSPLSVPTKRHVCLRGTVAHGRAFGSDEKTRMPHVERSRMGDTYASRGPVTSAAFPTKTTRRSRMKKRNASHPHYYFTYVLPPRRGSLEPRGFKSRIVVKAVAAEYPASDMYFTCRSSRYL